MQTPPPPSISPRQMNLLRIVASMAWADSELAAEEVDVMLDRFSGIFAADSPQQQHIRQELQDYLMQNIPLEELTPKLQTDAEKELVLKLGYEVIQSSSRTPNEDPINADEAAAYTKLVGLLGLPQETVKRVEAEAIADLKQDPGIVDCLTHGLEKFAQG
ncbi:TerB family tellurite resistance protein [Oscillatoria sp. FACHB-1407]|uniref:tellurite resistance TerB family protein n=1 Tax=Oscillatoria sp. FACHB-1407 TaxID=2692847 RepID=UPI001687C622|nr:TerB family tellurite resistance protein [Oscillatoria sp. FACHB-1407]MBD2463308.1 TerB family tellurite resistance protein [Oscillatoria sp. FACHB-1407]